MSMLENRVAEILTEAEEKVRRVIAEAAESGDYRGVDYGRRVAVAISEIGKGLGGSGGSSKANSVAEESASGKARRKMGGRKGRKGAYPRFEIEGDQLIKIGWSKKQKREYSHKVPKDVFERVVKGMAALARRSSGPFAVEDVIEIVGNEGGNVPSYQMYVVLAFLRDRGCVEQKGREGYEIPVSIENDASSQWGLQRKE